MNEDAVAHFAKRLRFETDCDDVAYALAGGAPEFVLVDVRSRAAFDAGHVPGALSFERPFAEKTSPRSVPDRSSSTAGVRAATAPSKPPCSWRRWAARSRKCLVVLNTGSAKGTRSKVRTPAPSRRGSTALDL